MTNPGRRSPFRAAPTDAAQRALPKVLLVDDRRDNLVALAARRSNRRNRQLASTVKLEAKVGIEPAYTALQASA